MEDAAISATATHELVAPVKQRWRIETDYSVNRAVNIVSRMEFLWINMKGEPNQARVSGHGWSCNKKNLDRRKYSGDDF